MGPAVASSSTSSPRPTTSNAGRSKHHSDGRKHRRLLVVGFVSLAFALVLLVTWQLSLYAREASSGSGSGIEGNRRSLLWRLKKLADGSDDGKVRDKAADLLRRRGASSSIHAALDRGVSDTNKAEALAKPPKAKGAISVGEKKRNRKAADEAIDDSQRNAVDDVGAHDNDDPDPRKRIVQGVRKVIGEGADTGNKAAAGDANNNNANTDDDSSSDDSHHKGKGHKKGGKGGKHHGKKAGGGGHGKGKGGKGGKKKAAAAEEDGEGKTDETSAEAGNDDAAPAAHQDHSVAEEPSKAVVVKDLTNAAPPNTSKHAVELRGSAPLPPFAYLLIISNELFLDGALVLGVSLRLHSPFLQQGKAAMTIIVPRGRLSDDSLKRLREEGSFDEIVIVESLAAKAPGAYWKDTFDKLYMFNLTQYEKVVFMDADMICMKSMDKLFETKLKDAKHVAAIGDKAGFAGTGGHAYFQTGMMVIQPSTEAFEEIMEEFYSGVPPRGQQYNKGMNGRDGVLLRNYFKTRFHPIDNKYSRNLNPRFRIPDTVVSLHPRGKHKPWFDWTLPIKDPELGKKEFGFPYIEWWSLYEDLVHKKAPLYQYALAKKEHQEGKEMSTFVEDPFYEERLELYGGTKRGDANTDGQSSSYPQLSPLTHVWIMRYSKDEYVQLLSDEDTRRRANITAVLKAGEQGGNVRNDLSAEAAADVERFKQETMAKADPSTFEMVVGKEGQSCDDVCKGSSLACVNQGFHYAGFQNCTVLQQLLGCEVCEIGVYWRPHPGNDYPASGYYLKQNGERKMPLRCFYNLMRDDRGLPRCNAYNESTTRVCPCASME